MGDACGIGPEIVAALFRDAGGAAGCFVVGDVAVMRRAAGVDRRPAAPWPRIERADDVPALPPRCLPVLQVDGLPADLLDAPVGRVDARAGAAAAALHRARGRARARAGEVGAIVTAPIHKEALAAAGVGYPGHTEMLQALAARDGRAAAGAHDAGQRRAAHRAGDDPPVAAQRDRRGDLRRGARDDAHRRTAARARWGRPRRASRSPGSTRMPARAACSATRRCASSRPAVAAARAEGIDARGPFAPDTVFMRARDAAGHPGEFDVVVAMTHDHGLIPVKYLGVEHGVNVTLGLPFVRTSPDHGTAFDIAGTGRRRSGEPARGGAHGAPR